MTSESDITRVEEVDQTNEKPVTPQKKMKIEKTTSIENGTADDEQVEAEEDEKETPKKKVKREDISSENEHTGEEEAQMKDTKTTPRKKMKVKEENLEKENSDEEVEKMSTKTTPRKKRKMKEENSEKENKEFEENEEVDTKITVNKAKTTPKKKAKTTPKKKAKKTPKKKAKVEEKTLKNENTDDEKVEEMDTKDVEEANEQTNEIIPNNEKGENMDTKVDSEDVNIIKKRKDLTLYFKKTDHSVNQVYQSKIPQICKDEPCQLGVDEAGRGPVLGPMVYGIAYAPLSQKQILVDIGCADSKTLSEVKRDAVFDKVCDNEDKMGWAVDAISPTYIANCMYRRSKTSLNEVSMQSAIDLIKMTLEAGVFVTEIYVDTVGKPEKYQARLQGIFPGIKITVAKKADSTYPIVSAASICAKVSRDHALRAWQFREAENETNYGSGYPNDPATKSWLINNIDQIFGFPQLVRFSWSTAEKILESKAITVEWEEVEDDESPPPGQKISKFFAPSPAKSGITKKRHNFFTHRCLSSAITL